MNKAIESPLGFAGSSAHQISSESAVLIAFKQRNQQQK